MAYCPGMGNGGHVRSSDRKRHYNSGEAVAARLVARRDIWRGRWRGSVRDPVQNDHSGCRRPFYVSDSGAWELPEPRPAIGSPGCPLRTAGFHPPCLPSDRRGQELGISGYCLVRLRRDRRPPRCDPGRHAHGRVGLGPPAKSPGNGNRRASRGVCRRHAGERKAGDHRTDKERDTGTLLRSPGGGVWRALFAPE